MRIYLLQDIHLDPKMENCIRDEWGYESYFASQKSNSRGFANSNLQFSVETGHKDVAGILLIDALSPVKHMGLCEG